MIVIAVVIVGSTNIAGVAQFWALVGTVAFLLALVPCDVVEGLSIWSWCHLSKSDPVPLSVVVIVVSPIASVLVLVMGKEIGVCSACQWCCLNLWGIGRFPMCSCCSILCRVVWPNLGWMLGGNCGQ